MTNKNNEIPAEMVREYKIGNTTFIVKSRSREDAKEKAEDKIKRLIHNEIQRESI